MHTHTRILHGVVNATAIWESEQKILTACAIAFLWLSLSLLNLNLNLNRFFLRSFCFISKRPKSTHLGTRLAVCVINKISYSKAWTKKNTHRVSVLCNMNPPIADIRSRVLGYEETATIFFTCLLSSFDISFRHTISLSLFFFLVMSRRIIIAYAFPLSSYNGDNGLFIKNAHQKEQKLPH